MTYDLSPSRLNNICLSVPAGRALQRTFAVRLVEGASLVFLCATALVTVAMGLWV